MTTAEFEFLLGNAPSQAGRKAEAKALRQNAVCIDAELRLARALKFEQALDQAFEIEVPDGLQAGLFAIADSDAVFAPPFAQAQANAPEATKIAATAYGVWRSLRWFALAVGILMFALAAYVGFQGPAHPLNAMLAKHCDEFMAHEPFALSRRAVVPKYLVERMFAMHGFATHTPDGRNLIALLGDVNYLAPCTVDGKTALHLVVQTAAGPVTALVLPNVANDGPSEVRIHSSLIRISPLSSAQYSLGAIVFMAESSLWMDAVEARFLQALERS